MEALALPICAQAIAEPLAFQVTVSQCPGLEYYLHVLYQHMAPAR